jgi:hypothetical protein
MGQVARTREMRNVYKVLVRKCEGKNTLGKLSLYAFFTEYKKRNTLFGG